MQILGIAAVATAVVLGGVGAARPADRPHIGHCHAAVAKPEIHDKGPAGPATNNRGGNNRSIQSGVDLHCK